MTQEELTQYNLGENLDQLMNIDPRGYGVCRILYAGSRAFTGEPLTMHSARLLKETLKEGDLVYLLTGFVLMPHQHGETDGMISTVLLARALVLAFGVRPVIVVPEINQKAAHALCAACGLHSYSSISEVRDMPAAAAVVTFTKDASEAPAMADQLLADGRPKAVIAIECPGANAKGVYHNALGRNFTPYEAKQDALFVRCQQEGILNIAVGDLGNELGMGAIGEHIRKYIPYAAENACSCDCHGGLLSAVAADHILTGTTSDWAVYGLIAAIAYLCGDLEIMHTPELEKKACETGCENGLVDMYGWKIPSIDGFDPALNCGVVHLMRECVRNAFLHREKCKTWFDKTIELGFFDHQ